MRIRLYIDEDAMGKGLVRAFRSHNIEVITAYEAGMAGGSDEAHLKYATANGLALYSYNRGDFMDLHTQFLERGLSHAGIILCANNRWSIGEQLRRLLLLVEARSSEEMQDQVVFLSGWG
jgi:hypothetical protein